MTRAQAQVATRSAERDADPYYHREKKLRLMVVNTSILEKQNDMISKQLTMLSNNEASFIRRNGQSAYDDKVDDLLTKLPDPVQALLVEDDDNDEIDDNEGSGGDVDWDQYDRQHGNQHPNNQLAD